MTLTVASIAVTMLVRSAPSAHAEPAPNPDAQPASSADAQATPKADGQPAPSADAICFRQGMPVSCDKPGAVRDIGESVKPTDEQERRATQMRVRDELVYTIGRVLDCERMNPKRKQHCYHPPPIRTANEMRACVKDRAKGRRYWMCMVDASVYRMEAKVSTLLAGRARKWCVKTTDEALIKRGIRCIWHNLEAKDLPLDKEDKWVDGEAEKRAIDRAEANKPENKTARATMETVEREAMAEVAAEIEAEKDASKAADEKRRREYDKAKKAAQDAADQVERRKSR